MKRRGCLVWGGALLFGLPTLIGVGGVAAAFLSIRSPGSASGAEPMAWVIVGAAVLVGAVLMAAVGAGLGWLVGRVLRGR